MQNSKHLDFQTSPNFPKWGSFRIVLADHRCAGRVKKVPDLQPFVSKSHKNLSTQGFAFIRLREGNLKKFLPLCIFCLEQPKVSFPFVSNHFTAREATNWNDHGVVFRPSSCKNTRSAFHKTEPTFTVTNTFNDMEAS